MPDAPKGVRVWPVLLALALATAPAAAQRRQPDTVVSADVDFLGAALSYARERGPGRYWGLELGLGGAFLHRMLYAGEHFADEGGPSYQAPDGAVDNALIEIVHAGVFYRLIPSSWVSMDLGARTSVFIHLESSHDHSATPLFAGLYANVLVGSRSFRVGPRVLAGVFSEGATAREFGLYLVPLSARFSFGW